MKTLREKTLSALRVSLTATACFVVALSLTGAALAQSKSKPSGGTVATAPAAIAIRGGKLLTVSHGTIENGVVVIENGKITAVGPVNGTNIPKNAQIVDATGMTVYPGLFDAETHLGLTEISAEQMTNDLVELSDEIMPHMHVTDAFHAESELIPVTRMNGVTHAVIAPQDGDSMPGQDSIAQLAGNNRDEMLIARDVALPINFIGDVRRGRRGEAGSSAQTRFPETRMGVAAQLRQAFLDAQNYAQKLAREEKRQQSNESAAGEPFKHDLKLEALLPYLQGKKPVVLAARQSDEVLTAVSLAREFNLRIILNHVDHAQRLLDEIAAYKVPVIVGPIYSFPNDEQRYDAVYSLPAQLARRGVKIAFASYDDDHNARNLPYAAGYAVAYGLPYDEALKAVTINPAEMFGLGDRLGSLDVGKDATVVVASGDPLDVRTDVKRVFISGREMPMSSKQTELRDRYMK